MATAPHLTVTCDKYHDGDDWFSDGRRAVFAVTLSGPRHTCSACGRKAKSGWHPMNADTPFVCYDCGLA